VRNEDHIFNPSWPTAQYYLCLTVGYGEGAVPPGQLGQALALTMSRCIMSELHDAPLTNWLRVAQKPIWVGRQLLRLSFIYINISLAR